MPARLVAPGTTMNDGREMSLDAALAEASLL
jgi:hypothetical protein